MFARGRLNRKPRITYIIERSIKIIIHAAIYIQQGLGLSQDNPTKSMLVINQIQTGVRLYCAIVPGCIGSDRQLISASPVEAQPAILYINKTFRDIRLQPNQNILIFGTFTIFETRTGVK